MFRSSGDSRGIESLAFAVRLFEVSVGSEATWCLKHKGRVEMLSLDSMDPLPPAPRCGPLCRSAASGHLVRARALMAPPPFLAPRIPLPGLVLARLFVARPSGNSATRVRCGPRPSGSLGNGRDCSVPARVATRTGRRLGIAAVRPLNGWGRRRN